MLLPQEGHAHGRKADTLQSQTINRLFNLDRAAGQGRGGGRLWCMRHSWITEQDLQGRLGRGAHVAFSLIQEDESSWLEADIQHILSARHIG